jgi:hypothetical protein
MTMTRQQLKKKILHVDVETVQHCIHVAKIESVVTDQKQEVLDMDAFDQRDKCRQHPSKLYSRKVSKLWFSTRCAESTKLFYESVYVASAAFWKRPNRM